MFQIHDILDSLTRGRCDCNHKLVVYELISRAYSMNARHWLVNTWSRNGLVTLGNEPLPEPMLTSFYNAIWRQYATMSYCLQFCHSLKRNRSANQFKVTGNNYFSNIHENANQSHLIQLVCSYSYVIPSCMIAFVGALGIFQSMLTDIQIKLTAITVDVPEVFYALFASTMDKLD